METSLGHHVDTVLSVIMTNKPAVVIGITSVVLLWILWRRRNPSSARNRKPKTFATSRLKSAKGAWRFLRMSRTLASGRRVFDPPSRIFDYSEDPVEERTMENMLQSLQAFCWAVEKPVFQELCDSIETLTFNEGDMLFEEGSLEDSVYVVQSGQVDVMIVEKNQDFVINSVKEGGNIFSMIAVIERLAGVQSTHVGLAARCVAPDTKVARLPLKAFCDACEADPDLASATVQTVTIKLSRVVYNALHTCLGLSGELVLDFRSATTHIQALTSTQSTPGPKIASKSVISSLGEKNIIDAALKDLQNALDLPDASLLEGALKLESISAGSQLLGQDSRLCNMYIVVHGVLQAFRAIADQEKGELFFTAQAGSLLGQLSMLSGEPATYSLRAKTDSVVISISRDAITSIFRKRPQSIVSLAIVMVADFPAFVRLLDHSLGWKQIDSGRSLYKQNDPSDCAYVILHGRFRTIDTTSQEDRELIAEHGRDEMMGLMEVVTSSPRLYTSIAVRDSEVCTISGGVIDWLKGMHPKIVGQLINIIGDSFADARIHGGRTHVEKLPMPKNRPPLRNLSTIAIVPASKDVPSASFSLELQHALSAIGPSLRLTSKLIEEFFGVPEFDDINEYHLQTWLSQHEETYRMILYQCDSTFTPWTRWCLRQADAVLEVALASSDPAASSKNEFGLEKVANRAQKAFVLLYSHDYQGAPKNTADWLAARGWCHGHYHIKCSKRMAASPKRAISAYRRLFDSEPNPFSDFSRLARYLTGTSIGLALGGGAARGIAHIGILRSMMEAGIPIDMIGGTSMGSFMSALWAKERNLTKLQERALRAAKAMGSKAAVVSDMTYPYTAMCTGRAFNSLIRDTFCGAGNGDGDSDIQIEDLWLPFACVTTNVTLSQMRIHTAGSLWRYIRASMTLAGLLPPLCDPDDGHLLVDGAYTNNVPADVLHAMGCSVVFTVDVGSADDTDLTNYGDEVSGWSLIRQSFWPGAKPMRVPSITGIQSRLAFVACCRQLATVKHQPYCVYVRPPIENYGSFDFDLFDEIYQVGYDHGRKFFSAYGPRFFSDLYKQRKVMGKRSKTASRSGSGQPRNYAELAEMVCRAEPLRKRTAKETEEEGPSVDESMTPGDENKQDLGESSPQAQTFIEDDDDLDDSEDDSNEPVANLDLFQARPLSESQLPSSRFGGISYSR